MKTNIKALILTLLISLSAATTFADRAGGGGGLIRSGTQLKTLAEAGFILERASNFVDELKYPDYYDLNEQTKAEVKNIVSLLPLNPNAKDNLINETIGSRTTFIVGTTLDQSQYKKIVSDYAAVVKSYNQRLDPSVFTLAAITQQGHGAFVGQTIILPNFDKLNAREQALILIHERNYRYITSGESASDRRKLLALILELDSEIYQILQAKELGISRDPMRTISVLKDLNIANDYTVAYYAVKMLQEKSNRPLLLEDFIVFSSFAPGHIYIGVDPSIVKRLSRFDSRALQIFEKAEFADVRTPGSTLDFSENRETVRDAAKRICESMYPQMKNDSRSILYAQDYAILVFSCDSNQYNPPSVLDVRGVQPVY